MIGLQKDQPEKLKKIFKNDKRILAVYLFGSRAKGNSSGESDYDLALLSEESLSSEEQADLNVSVVRALGCNRIDMVFLEEAPILLKYEIISEGKIIYSVLPDEKVNGLELSIYREYFHTERFRELQLKSLREAFIL